MNMSNKILITGGNGFIGTYVSELLLKDYFKYNLMSIDNHTSYNGLIPYAEKQWLIGERSKRNSDLLNAKVDISDELKIPVVFSQFKPTHVLHLAAYPRAKVVNDNPVLASKTLIGGLLNLLEQSKNVEQFIYISSSMVYGDFNYPITENDVCSPKSYYGILKLTGEQIVKAWAEKNKKIFTIIRPSAVYGPGDCIDRVVSKFFEAALKDGVLNVHGKSEVLDFTYVEDLAKGIVSVIGNEKSYNETFNMSRGFSRSLVEAAELIIKFAGKGTINIVDKHDLYPSRESLDCSKALTVLGFDPKTEIEEGFKKYYEWYEQNQLFWN
jgi:nucleoside-diphosphate-sugar epimerase